ncbi:MAG: phosphoethanolamine--lipid A transferase, partial [Sulfurimonas sp.]
MRKLTSTQLILLTSLFLLLFDNYTFFKNLIKVYTLNENLGFVLSSAVVLFFFTVLLLSLVSTRWTIKPIIIIVLLISSLTNYFMNSYNVVIDDSMIRNMMQTNMDESLDLVTLKQVLYFMFLGVLPSWYVYKVELVKRGFKEELVSRMKLILLSIVVIGASIFLFSKHYTSFAREHKPLRYTVNPEYWIYSTGKYINKTFNSGPIVIQSIGEDAKIVKSTDDNRSKLVIMVVGEAARADHFSLNGYKRETNPNLKNEDIINFSNMSSCGTSTAESVPCMFSAYDRDDYSYKKGISTENVLDVLKHTGNVAILWRDNNSDSKGVALRVPYASFKTSQNNSICIEGECRDIGMLDGLDNFIKENKGKDIFIILHQMGNHGPAYYRRYTHEYEKFTPVCKTNQLQECSQQEIINAYDNALLYTDAFLTEVIEFLKKYDKKYDTAMIYMADHGESLGENGVYLHGLPYFMAPDAQTHIGALMWFGKGMKKKINREDLGQRSR